jgi:hypothetical protein
VKERGGPLALRAPLSGGNGSATIGTLLELPGEQLFFHLVPAGR